ncbi:hypothetical protein [Metapseudomonas otitidis]|uniref:hypothetical protein n=1 Tax=Metapseudomonas otitidis TaxID=319939 RepID=UPI00273944D7|nr:MULTISPECIES: hypothetical protein [Pseudomonas]MDL5600397.1 hypothetical protein [Bacillus subtilis]
MQSINAPYSAINCLPRFRNPLRLVLSAAVLLLLPTIAIPCLAEPTFTGSWYLDLRTPEQQAAQAECGGAGFDLTQQGNTVLGTHYLATVNCGKLNDGGEVRGTVTGSEAVLFVTSGRTGEVVKGKATLEGDTLRWQVLETVKAGEPEWEPGLVLQSGVLGRREGAVAR